MKKGERLVKAGHTHVYKLISLNLWFSLTICLREFINFSQTRVLPIRARARECPSANPHGEDGHHFYIFGFQLGGSNISQVHLMFLFLYISYPFGIHFLEERKVRRGLRDSFFTCKEHAYVRTDWKERDSLEGRSCETDLSDLFNYKVCTLECEIYSGPCFSEEYDGSCKNAMSTLVKFAIQRFITDNSPDLSYCWQKVLFLWKQLSMEIDCISIINKNPGKNFFISPPGKEVCDRYKNYEESFSVLSVCGLSGVFAGGRTKRIEQRDSSILSLRVEISFPVWDNSFSELILLNKFGFYLEVVGVAGSRNCFGYRDFFYLVNGVRGCLDLFCGYCSGLRFENGIFVWLRSGIRLDLSGLAGFCFRGSDFCSLMIAVRIYLIGFGGANFKKYRGYSVYFLLGNVVKCVLAELDGNRKRNFSEYGVFVCLRRVVRDYLSKFGDSYSGNTVRYSDFSCLRNTVRFNLSCFEEGNSEFFFDPYVFLCAWDLARERVAGLAETSSGTPYFFFINGKFWYSGCELFPFAALFAFYSFQSGERRCMEYGVE
ncbi:MAG: hypothetical protein ACP6IS_10445 [Candidatus Asgardarchaeia archaeon]